MRPQGRAQAPQEGLAWRWGLRRRRKGNCSGERERKGERGERATWACPPSHLPALFFSFFSSGEPVLSLLPPVWAVRTCRVKPRHTPLRMRSGALKKGVVNGAFRYVYTSFSSFSGPAARTQPRRRALTTTPAPYLSKRGSTRPQTQLVQQAEQQAPRRRAKWRAAPRRRSHSLASEANRQQGRKAAQHTLHRAACANPPTAAQPACLTRGQAAGSRPGPAAPGAAARTGRSTAAHGTARSTRLTKAHGAQQTAQSTR